MSLVLILLFLLLSSPANAIIVQRAVLSGERVEVFPDPEQDRTFVYSQARIAIYVVNEGNYEAEIRNASLKWIGAFLPYTADAANPTVIYPGFTGIFWFETLPFECGHFGDVYTFHANITYLDTPTSSTSIRAPEANASFSVGSPLLAYGFDPSIAEPIEILIGEEGKLSFKVKNLGYADLHFNYTMSSDPPKFEGYFIECCCPISSVDDWVRLNFTLAGLKEALHEFRVVPTITGSRSKVFVKLQDSLGCEPINYQFDFELRSTTVHREIFTVRIAGFPLYWELILIPLLLLLMGKGRDRRGARRPLRERCS